MIRHDYEGIYIRELAAEITRRRERAGMTQTDLAQAADIPLSSVSRYANGRRDIPSGRLASIAQGLGVPLPDLVLEPAERARRAVIRQHREKHDQQGSGQRHGTR